MRIGSIPIGKRVERVTGLDLMRSPTGQSELLANQQFIGRRKIVLANDGRDRDPVPPGDAINCVTFAHGYSRCIDEGR